MIAIVHDNCIWEAPVSLSQLFQWIDYNGSLGRRLHQLLGQLKEMLFLVQQRHQWVTAAVCVFVFSIAIFGFVCLISTVLNIFFDSIQILS
jgi:hypothetical protein